MMHNPVRLSRDGFLDRRQYFLGGLVSSISPSFCSRGWSLMIFITLVFPYFIFTRRDSLFSFRAQWQLVSLGHAVSNLASQPRACISCIPFRSVDEFVTGRYDKVRIRMAAQRVDLLSPFFPRPCSSLRLTCRVDGCLVRSVSGINTSRGFQPCNVLSAPLIPIPCLR